MNTQNGSIKKYILIIIFILAVAFLSQQIFFREAGKTFVSGASRVGTYLSKGSDWALSAIYPKISGEVQSRGDAIKTEVIQEKNKISENILTKAKNYFSGIADSILHPGENNNCPAQPAETTPGQ